MLVGRIKKDVKKEADPVLKKRLEWAVRSMTHTTSTLVAAAKAVAKEPGDVPAQASLQRVCDALAGMALSPHAFCPPRQQNVYHVEPESRRNVGI